MNSEKIEELSKNVRISEEYARLASKFVNADKNKRAVIESLLQNAAFMAVTLQDLQEIINEEGATEVYQNGEHQHGLKQSSAMQAYNSLVKNYMNVMKSLTTLVPPEERPQAPTKLEEYMKQLHHVETEEERAERMRLAEEAAAEAGRLLQMCHG